MLFLIYCRYYHGLKERNLLYNLLHGLFNTFIFVCYFAVVMVISCFLVFLNLTNKKIIEYKSNALTMTLENK